ncbi:MAG: GAF domain-containing protein [Pseudomonadota bacterium]|nr:GAF domain-containing protein [Pseudomonadota bacterium]
MLDIIGEEQEPEFDRIGALVARLLRVPVALVSIVETDRQFFKSQLGLASPYAESRQTPLSHSFCRLVVQDRAPLVVADSRQDDRVKDNPAIRDLGVAAYLGAPIVLGDGRVVGSLCAIEHVAREWSPDDLAILTELAALVATEIDLRAEVKRRKSAEDDLHLMARELEHRVKNAFSMVQAIVSLSLRAPDVAGLRRDLIERIGAVGATQELLATWAGSVVTFAEILKGEVAPYDPGGERLDAVGPAIAVDARDAVFIGMIVHELTTNAVKHGALNPEGKGILSIRWNAEDEGGYRWLVLEWNEDRGANSSPGVKQSVSSGFGTELLDLLIKRQLFGTIERLDSRRGLSLKLRLRLTASPEGGAL